MADGELPEGRAAALAAGESAAAMVGYDRVIVALDAATTEENLNTISRLRGITRWFKVGLRAYYAGGDHLMEAVRAADAQLFLDLKVHDIPDQVGGAMGALARHVPELVTVHAAGAGAMVAAARASAGPSTRVVAVTVLTSLDAADLRALGVSGTPSEVVRRWGALALAAGADGLVSSGQEVEGLRAAHPNAILVTPGIRSAGDALGDQKRVVTAGAAIAAGASYVVVGRPITSAVDPASALAAIAGERVVR